MDAEFAKNVGLSNI